MTEQSPESKISDIIKTIRSWSLLWDLDELLNEIIKNSVLLLNADFGYLLLLETNGLSIKAQWANQQIKPIPYLPEIAEKVIRHGAAIYAHDLIQGAHAESQVYCVPMTANRGVLGVIYIQLSNRTEEISQDEKLLFEMLGLQAASFLENSILYHSAITDPLTGLYSHRHFQQECDQMMRRASRTQTQITMMILDLDHFKQLNDKHGHEEGNICLKRISEILRSKFRITDIVARFGGDEFEMLLPDASAEKSLGIANALIETIRNEKFPLQISGTIGIATYPTHAVDTQSLFLAADQALYIGKKQGRNCAVVSTLDVKSANQNLPQLKDSNALRISDATSIQASFPDNIKKDIQRIDGLDIISRINSSSNGEVLLAKQHELDRFVALKRPLTAHLSEEQSAAFKKEAFITASLSHPGVVPLYTMGRGIDGRLYYTMKPINGLSLDDLLIKWKSKDSQIIKDYNLIKLIHILLKASETVAYAHSHEIAHLDIHPGNIIIGEFGEITLIDWGKGIKLNDQITETSTKGIYISGSPVYRAPEQLISDKVGKFTDVYSLGIILFEMLTDKTPFKKNSTKETIEAITKGIELTQESNRLNQGIDPLLSKICRAAINKNAEERISAAEFSKALSRFVMLEADIKIYQFNTLETPMKDEDWYRIDSNSGWSLNEGVWSTNNKNQQHMLYWKPPITGNFSFISECWVTESPREIGIVAFGKSIKDSIRWVNRKEAYKGYCFQFGADNNLYTKLARHGDDILVDANFTTEVNRKYIITVSYQDGWLHCYIDKVLVFQYRELHPFNGAHLGFYGWGNGSHFRPIEVRYQSTGLMVPAIRLADEHLTYGRYDVAISRYNEIIQAFPDRLEGFESILKKGFCYAKTNKPKEALEAFESLKNTILEPYALTEIALMELPNLEYEISQKEGDYKKAYFVFKELVEKFPRHQAIFRILFPCHLLRNPQQSNSITFKKNREETLTYKMELQKIGVNTLSPPGQTQINCFESMINHLALLGLWEEAINNLKALLAKWEKYFYYNSRSLIDLQQLCYSCNEWELIKNNYDSSQSHFNPKNLYPIIILEMFDAHEAMHYYEEKVFSDIWFHVSYRIVLSLGIKKDVNILNLFNPYFINNNNYLKLMATMRLRDYLAFEMLLAVNEKSINDILEFLTLFSKESNEHAEEANNLKNYYLAIKELFNFNLNGSLNYINESNNFTTKIEHLQEKRLVLTCFLYSLEYFGDLNKEELIFQNKIYLAGPRLELASNFLKEETFTLSSKFPKKPSAHYLDRVIYCVWLYEKKEFQLLKNTLSGLINPKLGDSYFQPFLLKLDLKVNEKLNA
jgi:diguanylate cyclase (GGDEF)-like protein